MTHVPAIYAIVVTFNGMRWLPKCFESLLSSEVPVRVVVIDNCSTDGSPEFISKKFPDVHLIRNHQNEGFGKANNIGIRYALKNSADYFLLINQDAWLDKQAVGELIKTFKSDESIGIASPVQLNGNGTALDFAFKGYLKRYGLDTGVENLLANHWSAMNVDVRFVNAAAWMINRKCIEVVGGFNPLYPHYGEDNDYVNRLWFHGLKLSIRCNALIYHDRKQGAGPVKLSVLKKREYVSFLKQMTNIQLSLFESITHIFIKLIRELVFHTIKLQGVKALALVIGFCSCLKSFPRALRSRSRSKEKGAFL